MRIRDRERKSGLCVVWERTHHSERRAVLRENVRAREGAYWHGVGNEFRVFPMRARDFFILGKNRDAMTRFM